MQRGKQARKEVAEKKKAAADAAAANATATAAPEADTDAAIREAATELVDEAMKVAMREEEKEAAPEVAAGMTEDEAATKIQAISRGKATRAQLKAKNAEAAGEATSPPEDNLDIIDACPATMGNPCEFVAGMCTNCGGKDPSTKACAEPEAATAAGITEDEAATKIQAVARGRATRKAQKAGAAAADAEAAEADAVAEVVVTEVVAEVVAEAAAAEEKSEAAPEAAAGMTEDEAATKIQAMSRGKATRAELKSKKDAAAAEAAPAVAEAAAEEKTEETNSTSNAGEESISKIGKEMTDAIVNEAANLETEAE